MTRTHLIAGGIVLIGALSAALITLFVLFLYEPGRERHAVAMPDDTAIRVVMEPARVQRYVSSLAPGITRFVSTVPKVTSMQSRAFRVDWVHAMPYEIALLFSAPGNNTMDATLFINPLPESSFLSEFNAWGALRELRGVAWSGSGAREVTPAYATASGTVPVNASWNAGAQKPSIHALGTPEIEGGHWLEVAAVNADDVFSHLYAAMDRAWRQPGTEASAAALTRALPYLRRARLTGDLTADDELYFVILLELADPAGRAAVDEAMAAVADAMAAGFADRWGWSFGGGFGWTGPAALEGSYHLRGFEARLRRAMGG